MAINFTETPFFLIEESELVHELKALGLYVLQS